MTPSLSLLSRGEEQSDDRETAADERREAVGDERRGADRGRSLGPPSLLARLLYGGVLIFTGLNHFRNVESMTGYAESKGVPMADLAVPFSGGMLVTGGLGIILWRLPRLAAGAAVTFFVGATPVMHDFWNVDEGEKQQQMNHFLKNVGLLGAALAFLSRANKK